jgi:hypothetical protein
MSDQQAVDLSVYEKAEYSVMKQVFEEQYYTEIAMAEELLRP